MGDFPCTCTWGTAIITNTYLQMGWDPLFRIVIRHMPILSRVFQGQRRCRCTWLGVFTFLLVNHWFSSETIQTIPNSSVMPVALTIFLWIFSFTKLVPDAATMCGRHGSLSAGRVAKRLFNWGEYHFSSHKNHVIWGNHHNSSTRVYSSGADIIISMSISISIYR